MTGTIAFDPVHLSAETEVLRTEVRDFLREEIQAGNFEAWKKEFFRRLVCR